MPYFIRNGNTYRVASEDAMDLQKKLPVGNYTVGFNEMQGFFYLEMIAPFNVPEKLYGDVTKHTDRILNTFNDRPGSTGVILNGEKGSGKTLLAKNLSVVGAKNNDIPSIIINQSWHGDTFNKFIQDIEQPCIVLFDEFEKVYDDSEQEAVLTLLDGVYNSKKLFIITCNDKWRIDQNMRNRPGRIYYMLDFAGLDTDFILEYCQDNLINKEYKERVCAISTMFDSFNFDMLKSLVEEMNRYNEPPQEAIKILNVKAEHANRSKFVVQSLIIGGKEITNSEHGIYDWSGNPLSSSVTIEWGFKVPPNKDSEYETFSVSDIVRFEGHAGKFVYENESDNKLVLVREKPVIVDYFSNNLIY